MSLTFESRRAQSNRMAPGASCEPDSVEYVATVRGRTVSCWVERGELLGDDELVARVRRAARGRDLTDPVGLARIVGDAVGSPVTVRFRSSGGQLRVW